MSGPGYFGVGSIDSSIQLLQRLHQMFAKFHGLLPYALAQIFMSSQGGRNFLSYQTSHRVQVSGNIRMDISVISIISQHRAPTSGSILHLSTCYRNMRYRCSTKPPCKPKDTASHLLTASLPYFPVQSIRTCSNHSKSLQFAVSLRFEQCQPTGANHPVTEFQSKDIANDSIMESVKHSRLGTYRVYRNR